MGKKVFLNSIFSLSVLLPLMFIFSCNNSSESKLAYADIDTVKETVKQREVEIAWTKELEPGRLSENLDAGVIFADENMTADPDLVKIIKDYNNPVYPELLDFGVLDSTSLSYSARERINNFCSSLSLDIYSGPEMYFSNSYIFNYVFFKNDFIGGWLENFDEDYPLTEKLAKENREKRQKNKQIEDRKKQKEQQEKERAERIANGEATEEDLILQKNETKIEDEKEEIPEVFEEVNIFDKWIIGQPFIGPEIVQVPVRFYCKQGTVDVTLYINQIKQNSIYQITIDRWIKA